MANINYPIIIFDIIYNNKISNIKQYKSLKLNIC